MVALTSACLGAFGHEDFDTHRLRDPASRMCPVKECPATLVDRPYGKQRDRDGRTRVRTLPWCPEHGIRLHSGTFVYWNGDDLEDEARLRNFIVRPDLVRAIALPKGMKAESYRLGYEMSEDALSWNVFVSLAVAGRLGEAARYLTDKPLRSEPSLYLWGRKIDVEGLDFAVFPDLLRVRSALEKGIRRFPTEPDIMLIAPGEMVICVEAKFGSGNPLARNGAQDAGEKPHSREGILARYLVPSEYARGCVQPDRIGVRFHSQLFRNVVFACEMARELPWHVVNLVRQTNRGEGEDGHYSFAPPTDDVRGYLRPDLRHCFTYRTWEGLYAAVVRDDASLAELGGYLHRKSAHYERAFVMS
jgi:hypothetical protein